MAAWLLTIGGLLGLAYVLAGYPALLALATQVRPRPLHPEPRAERPQVSLLISAYNETRDLARKVHSLWELRYPPDRYEVLIADDGSSDGTGELIDRLAAEPVAAGRLRRLPPTENLGKATQLNRLVAHASGDILVFTDARQPLDPDAIDRLVEAFADERVGGATGAVVYRTPEGQPVPIGAYWRYESWLRDRESRLHSCCGAAGPLCAMRRELFRPLPENVVLDDVLGPMRVVLGRRRFVYVGDAVAYETYAMNRRHEFDRRVRTMAGNYQVLRLEPRLLLPWRNPIWWQYVSHKVGRLLVPWFLLAVLAGSLLGWHQGLFFRVVLGLQIAFYAYAAVGWASAGKRWAPRGSAVAYSLALLAATALVGLGRDLRGGSRARWASTERSRRG